MQPLHSSVQIQVDQKTFLKDPRSSQLGNRIVMHSIILIDQLGFEQFTFRKLGLEIGSNESSIYRYFENKHKLLLYLASLYWGWKEYILVFETHNLSDPRLKLSKSIEILANPITGFGQSDNLNKEALENIMVNEYSKSYLTKEVDKENKEGYFELYKRLANRMAGMVVELNPTYPYPHSLISTVLEGILYQSYLGAHFPSLTDCNDREGRIQFFTHLVMSSLKSN